MLLFKSFYFVPNAQDFELFSSLEPFFVIFYPVATIVSGAISIYGQFDGTNKTIKIEKFSQLLT